MVHLSFPPGGPAGAADSDEFLTILEASARTLARSGDAGAFLDWIAEAGPLLAPEMAASVDPRTGPPGRLFRALGVNIYKAMPLPEQGFARKALPRPGRNEPCLCGSGEKYKRCCLPMDGIFDLRDYNILRHMLDVLPRERFAQLPASAVDLPMVYDTALQWQSEGETERAVALLEAFFSGKGRLTRKLDLLFDALMDCYLELARPRKRERLLAEVAARGDRELRATALQRQATMLADNGEFDAAWRTFQQAQQENPEDPALAILEITLLMSRKETEQARVRARFWLARLLRSRHPNPDLIELLEAVALDPEAAFTDMARDMFPPLNRLAQLFESAPPLKAYYQVELADGEGMLAAEREITALEASWRSVFPQIKPSLTATQHGDDSVWNDADDWLPFLESTPLAWQSLEVLDDLVMALDAVQLPVGETADALLEGLLERAMALLEANLSAAGADKGRLPWACLENRPALRLLAHRVFFLLQADPEAAGSERVMTAERLLALNPNDNHGVRALLSRAYLEQDATEKVIDLSARYPDDFCAMTLNRILALYRLDRRGEALQALHDAARQHAVAITMLVAAKPKKPAISDHGISLGGKDEAWLYRVEHRALWEKDGALAWLDKAWKAVKR